MRTQGTATATGALFIILTLTETIVELSFGLVHPGDNVTSTTQLLFEACRAVQQAYEPDSLSKSSSMCDFDSVLKPHELHLVFKRVPLHVWRKLLQSLLALSYCSMTLSLSIAAVCTLSASTSILLEVLLLPDRPDESRDSERVTAKDILLKISHLCRRFAYSACSS